MSIKHLGLEQELKLWRDVMMVLRSVPNDMRSQYHTNYLNEVEQRVYETEELIKNL